MKRYVNVIDLDVHPVSDGVNKTVRGTLGIGSVGSKQLGVDRSIGILHEPSCATEWQGGRWPWKDDGRKTVIVSADVQNSMSSYASMRESEVHLPNKTCTDKSMKKGLTAWLPEFERRGRAGPHLPRLRRSLEFDLHLVDGDLDGLTLDFCPCHTGTNRTNRRPFHNEPWREAQEVL